VSVFAGIVSSSGTDVPAQDWTLIGEDRIDAGSSNELAVLGGALSYSSVKFIADIDSAGTQTVNIFFPQSPIGAQWWPRTITESGLSEPGVQSTIVSETGIYFDLDTSGRYVIFGEITQSDIPGAYGRVTIDIQRTNSPTDFQMTTIEGWITSASPWSTADFTMTSTVATGFNAGSRLSIYSSPVSVTG
jgi:hypothetical protein